MSMGYYYYLLMLFFNLGHLLHVTLLQIVQMVIVTEVYTSIDMSLHNQVNFKQSSYFNSGFEAYLHELTFSLTFV
jgi:hypothetical protein